VENFLVWKAKFDQELAVLNAEKRKKDEEKKKKPTGYNNKKISF
jgi:hypothetical protein